MLVYILLFLGGLVVFLLFIWGLFVLEMSDFPRERKLTPEQREKEIARIRKLRVYGIIRPIDGPRVTIPPEQREEFDRSVQELLEKARRVNDTDDNHGKNQR